MTARMELAAHSVGVLQVSTTTVRSYRLMADEIVLPFETIGPSMLRSEHDGISLSATRN